MFQKAFNFLFSISLLFWAQSSFAFNRIVTLSPVIGEWTSIILGDAQSKKSLVGVSEFSDYPTYLSQVTSIGPYPKLDIEKIAALKPDLVIASSEYNREEQIDQLRRMKLQVQVLPKETFSQMDLWILSLGEILHEKKGALQAKKAWEKGIEDLQFLPKRGAPKRYFMEVQHLPLISVGGDSFLNDAMALVGYQNIFGELKQAYPKVSKEAVLKENPETIFILGMNDKKEESESAQADWKTFSNLNAVQKKDIRVLSADDFGRCSLRLLKALKQLD